MNIKMRKVFSVIMWTAGTAGAASAIFIQLRYYVISNNGASDARHFNIIA